MVDALSLLLFFLRDLLFLGYPCGFVTFSSTQARQPSFTPGAGLNPLGLASNSPWTRRRPPPTFPPRSPPPYLPNSANPPRTRKASRFGGPEDFARMTRACDVLLALGQSGGVRSVDLEDPCEQVLASSDHRLMATTGSAPAGTSSLGGRQVAKLASKPWQRPLRC